MMNTRRFYDRISGAYDLIADAGERACRDQGLRALGVTGGEHVLEVGFGTGHALVALASLVGSGGLVCGVDISEGMLGVARRAVQASGAHNVALSIGDGRALSFRNASFDAAFMSFTLELFDPVAMAVVLDEVRRVIRPTGRVGIVAMAESANQNIMIDMYAWLHRHFPHFVDCRPIDLAGLLVRAGFRVRTGPPMSIWQLPVAACVGLKADTSPTQA